MSNLQYDFTFEDVKNLVKFFRKSEVPVELECIYSYFENHIYSNMTIEEAEIFLNEK